MERRNAATNLAGAMALSLGDCSGSTAAVSQDSWGRIKASFR